jgi:hypothetical protein
MSPWQSAQSVTMITLKILDFGLAQAVPAGGATNLLAMPTAPETSSSSG